MNEDEKDLDGRDAESGSEKSEQELEGREASPDTERDADDTGEEDGGDGRESKGLQKRISKVTAQRRKAEQERDAALARVAAYEAKERDKEARQRAQEAATPEGQKRLERKQAIRAAIDEAYGDGTSDLLEDQRSEREIQKEQYALNGVSYLKSELEDHGVVVDDRTLVRWEHAVGSELQEDPQLLAAFRRPSTQQAAIAEAAKRVREGLVNPLLKQQGGKPLQRIERNRDALLGSNKPGADTSQPFPEDYIAKPPKNATPAQLEEFWSNHREELKKKLWEANPD